MTRPPVNHDLFGLPPTPARDRTPVTLRMRQIDRTELGLFLSLDGVKNSAKWAPASEIKRGEGADENLFTMPKWVARERGWL